MVKNAHCRRILNIVVSNGVRILNIETFGVRILNIEIWGDGILNIGLSDVISIFGVVASNKGTLDSH